MKEQIISERANIIANLRQLVQSLVELNMRAKTHVSSNKADIKKLRKDNKELEKMKMRYSFFMLIFSFFFNWYISN